MPAPKMCGEMDYCMTHPQEEMMPADMIYAGILPRSYVIDQPYIGLLPLADGMHRGTVFPNIILPPRKEEL